MRCLTKQSVSAMVFPVTFQKSCICDRSFTGSGEQIQDQSECYKEKGDAREMREQLTRKDVEKSRAGDRTP